MNAYRFCETADRSGTGSLKDSMTPAPVKEAGLPGYRGAEFDFPTCPAFSEGVKRCAERGMANPYNRLLVFSNPNNPTGMLLTETVRGGTRHGTRLRALPAAACGGQVYGHPA